MFDVYIQNQFYKTINAKNLTEVIKLVSSDITNNLVSFYDNTQSENIRIVPKNNVIWDWRSQ